MKHSDNLTIGLFPRYRGCCIILLLITVASVVLSAQATAGASSSIDLEHSTITVHVYRSGLFSFAGDNHDIKAPIASGVLNETARTVELTIDVRRMRVLDPNL